MGIIPARGGSKKIINKNLKHFCGKPLIGWTIETALKSAPMDRLIVSTDSQEIVEVAKKYGADVPFIRPNELATDTIGIEPVLQHAYQWLLKDGYSVDALALLFATNPLRQTFHINEAINIFQTKQCDSVVSVNETPANHTPYWTLTKSNDGGVCLFGGVPLENILNRRQDFPQKCYARNDLVYVLKPQNLYENPPRLYGSKVELYETNPLYEIDINTEEDWQEAEIKFKKLNKLAQ